MSTSLVSFNESDSFSTIDVKGGHGARLLSAKEYKAANGGIKGADARRKYNDYLRASGRANCAALAAAMSSGELLVKSYRDYNSGSLTVGFIRKSSIKDPAAKAGELARATKAAADAAAKASALEALLNSLGLTAEDIAKALTK